VLIFVEVLTGLARTGTLFAFDHHDGAIPDILLLAKALGGGLPLGAFIASKRLMRTLAENPPLGHVTTFGGHPLSCAAGMASLGIIVRDNLAERAEHVGRAFAVELMKLLPQGCLRTVRQAGLLLGLEMTSAELVRRFTRECRAEGLIMGWTLHNDHVVRLAPPLVITRAELDEAAHRMARAAIRACATT
jgi:acetylornithine/succinyldiaminopimelate/putrescine aminotransferase